MDVESTSVIELTQTLDGLWPVSKRAPHDEHSELQVRVKDADT